MSNFILKAKLVEMYGTQADFAKVVGVDPPLVSQVIRGRKVLSEDKKVEWAKALKADKSLFDPVGE